MWYVKAMGGTWAWAAPEVILGKRSSTPADIYSFGVVLWELVTGEPPVWGSARDVLGPYEGPPLRHRRFFFSPPPPLPPHTLVALLLDSQCKMFLSFCLAAHNADNDAHHP